MGILTGDMRRVVEEQQLGFVANVCHDGTPNLSPKGTTVWDDNHLVFADICSPNTIETLRHNSAIEINVVDMFSRKGFVSEGPRRSCGKGEGGAFSAPITDVRASLASDA